eukprot:jgi/Ulvmu1/9001/UM005_0092.1
MTWPLYSRSVVHGIVASSVVWVSTVQFLLVGLKIVHDPKFASSMGAPPGQEHTLLRGPVQYGTIIASLTMFRFKSPFSIIPIGVLCGGDAIAALIGNHFGTRRLPWNENKTVLGTCGFFTGAVAVTSGLLTYMHFLDASDFDWIGTVTLRRMLVASLAGAVVETAPPAAGLGNMDNLLVPASSIAVLLAL